MVTSPVSSAMVTFSLVEVVVSARDDTHIGNDDWVGGGINSDNLGFESDESGDEDDWMDEDNSSQDDDGEDEMFSLILLWENLNLVCMNLHNFLMI